jgi:hypothetical protein
MLTVYIAILRVYRTNKAKRIKEVFMEFGRVNLTICVDGRGDALLYFHYAIDLFLEGVESCFCFEFVTYGVYNLICLNVL